MTGVKEGGGGGERAGGGGGTASGDWGNTAAFNAANLLLKNPAFADGVETIGLRDGAREACVLDRDKRLNGEPPGGGLGGA
jgi:hypothetical protein